MTFQRHHWRHDRRGDDALIASDLPEHTHASTDQGGLLTLSSLTVPQASVYHDAAQSENTATWKTLAFNSETIDTAAMHDLVTNNSRITCQVAGTYVAVAWCCFAANATGERHAAIMQGGVTTVAYHGVAAAPTNATEFSLAMSPLVLTIGDYLELQHYQTSGGSLAFTGGGGRTPRLAVWRIA